MNPTVRSTQAERVLREARTPDERFSASLSFEGETTVVRHVSQRMAYRTYHLDHVCLDTILEGGGFESSACALRRPLSR